MHGRDRQHEQHSHGDREDDRDAHALEHGSLALCVVDLVEGVHHGAHRRRQPPQREREAERQPQRLLLLEHVAHGVVQHLEGGGRDVRPDVGRRVGPHRPHVQEAEHGEHHQRERDRRPEHLEGDRARVVEDVVVLGAVAQVSDGGKGRHGAAECCPVCGRFTLTINDRATLGARFGVGEQGLLTETLGRANVCPTETVAAVVADADGRRRARGAALGPGAVVGELGAMRPLINARDDKLRIERDVAHARVRRRGALPRPRRRLDRVAEARGPEAAAPAVPAPS